MFYVTRLLLPDISISTMEIDQGEGDEGEPHEAGALSRAHAEALGKDRQQVKVSPRFPGPEGKTSPEQRSRRRCGEAGSS